MKKTVALVVALGCAACTGGQNEKSTETTENGETRPEEHDNGPGPTKATEPTKKEPMKTTMSDAKARAQGILAKQAPKATIEVNVVNGPDGLAIIRARDPAAYPGTGVISLIFDEKKGATFGANGDNKLAQLFVDRGWFAAPPSDADILKLVHEAFFDGILILEAPTVEKTADAITVTLPATTMSGDPDRTHVVTLSKDGNDDVKTTP